MLAGRSAVLPQRAMAPTIALPGSRILPAALTAQAPPRESAAQSRRALVVQARAGPHELVRATPCRLLPKT